MGRRKGGNHVQYYIRGAKLLDGETYYEQANLLVSGGMILRVDCENTPPADAQIIDLTGYTLLPAFVDAHVHVSAALTREGTFDDAAIRQITEKGVCMLKDMGAVNSLPLEPYMDWLGSLQGPRYAKVYTAGRYIDVDGGYGMGPSFDGPSPKWGIEVTSAQEAADAVRYQHANGTHGVKIGISDGGMGPKEGELPAEFIASISEAADELGMWTTAHIYKAEDLGKVVTNGIKEAGHTPKDHIPDDLLKIMVERGISMTSTIGAASSAGPGPGGGAPQVNEVARDHLYDNLLRFHKMGGRINAGSDTFLGSGGHGPKVFGIPVAEFQHLTALGLSMQEAITCGTRNGALACGVPDHGFLKAGYQANLIAVKGALSEDFRQLAQPDFVMNQGTILYGSNCER